MSRSGFFKAIKIHTALHPGMLGVVGRVICYTIGVVASMLVSDGIFNDGYSATISAFLLFAVVFELLWNNPAATCYEKAIHSHCMACQPGGTPERIMNCPQTECPLHSVRPYQLFSVVRLRLLAYIICVIGIGVVGFVLWTYQKTLNH